HDDLRVGVGRWARGTRRDPRHRPDPRRGGGPGDHGRGRAPVQLRRSDPRGVAADRRPAVPRGAGRGRRDGGVTDVRGNLTASGAPVATGDRTAPTPATQHDEPARPGPVVRRVPGPVLLGVLAAALVAVCVVAAGMGAYSVPPTEVVGSVLRRLGLADGTAVDSMADRVLWEIRLPRVALAAVVGSALGCAGATMQ